MLGSVAGRLPRPSLPFRKREATRPATARAISVSREVLLFVFGCMLAAGVIGGLSFWQVNGAATAEAINDAETVTQIDAHGIVQPMLTPSLLAGAPASIQVLDAVVHGGVIGGRVVRVKIWTAAGTVVYSDEHALIGETFALGVDEREALDAGETRSEVSDLTRPENRFERSFGSLVEVYLPITATNGTKLLFETYQLKTALQADQTRVWNGIFPSLVAGLALLFIVQVPLSWRLARRLQRSSLERAVLLQRAIDSSETERWRIAGDLHDGPVQNLTAVSLTLGSAAMRLANPSREHPSHEELVSVMQTASEESRTAIRELRTMIMEIAPPDLDRGGLGAAIERLAAVARENGIEVVVEVDPAAKTLPMRDTALIYRTAQEGIRNVVKHAHATRLLVRLLQMPGGMNLEIIDDGDGFSPDQLTGRQQAGHMGLSLLQERVAEAGASLTIDSMPGHGTSIRLRVARA
ncbi:MAG: sensor histidine kinase [Candidatus Dormiibacterota bacterium]